MAPDRETVKLLCENALNFFSSTENTNVYDPAAAGHDEAAGYSVVKLKTKDGAFSYFLLLAKLGAGAFGEVYKGVQLDMDAGMVVPGTEAAIKITDITQGGTVSTRDLDGAMAESIHENNILDMIDQSYGFSVGKRQKLVEIEMDELPTQTVMANVQETIVAMPLFPGANIEHEVHRDRFSYGSLTFAQLASRLSKNLSDLHDKTIVHADLKPANVIWDAENGLAQIVDFNRAKIVEKPNGGIFDSSSSDKEYMAPECFPEVGGYRYSRASDVFALGLILSEKFDMVRDAFTHKGTLQNKPYLSYDELLTKQFINKMLSDEQDRPTAEQCAQFFGGIERKLQYDIEQPDNELRLRLSKKLIDLEIYANQLEKEMRAESGLHHLLAKGHLVADKTKKYEQALKTIGLLVDVLSKEVIDTQPLKDQELSLARSDAAANGFFSHKGRYQQLRTELMQELGEVEESTPQSSRTLDL